MRHPSQPPSKSLHRSKLVASLARLRRAPIVPHGLWRAVSMRVARADIGAVLAPALVVPRGHLDAKAAIGRVHSLRAARGAARSSHAHRAHGAVRRSVESAHGMSGRRAGVGCLAGEEHAHQFGAEVLCLRLCGEHICGIGAGRRGRFRRGRLRRARFLLGSVLFGELALGGLDAALREPHVRRDVGGRRVGDGLGGERIEVGFATERERGEFGDLATRQCGEGGGTLDERDAGVGGGGWRVARGGSRQVAQRADALRGGATTVEEG